MGPGKSRELRGQLHRTIPISELLTLSFDHTDIVCVLGDLVSTRRIPWLLPLRGREGHNLLTWTWHDGRVTRRHERRNYEPRADPPSIDWTRCIFHGLCKRLVEEDR